MPRKGPVPKREIPPDPVYRDVLVAKLINKVMKEGKKTKAQRIVYGAFEIIRQRTKRDPLEVFRAALEQVKPLVEVRPRRVGGATYQVPVEVRPERQISVGLRWLVEYARARGGKPMMQKLAEELMDAAEGRGGAVRKREEVHRMAEANRAFAHYRW